MSYHDHYDAERDKRWPCLTAPCLTPEVAPMPELAVTAAGIVDTLMLARAVRVPPDILDDLRDAQGIAQALERRYIEQQAQIAALIAEREKYIEALHQGIAFQRAQSRQVAALTAREAARTAVFRTLLTAYDHLSDDDPRGRAAEFDAALAVARKALDA